MPSWKIPLYKIYWDKDDENQVAKVIRQGMFWATGPNIEKFESVVANQVGKKHAVAFNSGTSALHAMLLAYGVQSGDEVIVPSFTFIATANSVLFVGAKPVFADVETETCGLDPEDVQKKISSRTKAIMPIHYGGLPCHIKELTEIAEDHKLLLIEDAAEALGAKVDGKPAGSFGDAAMLSFCGNKVITTGEGGMIVTDEHDVYEKLKLVRSHGRAETENYFTSTRKMDYVKLGYNWRMSNILAAVGISQMRKLDKAISMRRKNAAYLSQRLSNIDGLKVPNPPPGYFHVYQMYTIEVNGERNGRDDIKNHLADKGIMTKVYFFPVHLTQFYRESFGFQTGELPATEELSERVLTLPMYASMTVDEMNYVISSIRERF
jgi:dTDP-4-amino-4,6-dideoxygalactose transaminase